MESFFAHNDLNIDFDDIRSLEDFMNAFQRLNDFEQTHIYQIQALENEILEKRKTLSEKYGKLNSLQNQTERLNKVKKIEEFKRTFERLEMDFSDSLYAFLIDHRNLMCDSNQKLERVMIPLESDFGKEFAVYVDPKLNQIQKISVVVDEQTGAERKLGMEEIMAVFFDISDSFNRDIKRDDLPQNNPDKLLGLEMGNMLLEFAKRGN